eukprot:624509-Prymnesium_polylepis.1
MGKLVKTGNAQRDGAHFADDHRCAPTPSCEVHPRGAHGRAEMPCRPWGHSDGPLVCRGAG